MVLIIAIVLAIALAVYRNYLKEMAQKAKIIGYDTRTGIALYEGEKVIGYDTQTGRPIIKGREEPKQEKQKEDKSKISNSILMIVGAGLIVFATLVFLSSSWDSIPNIIIGNFVNSLKVGKGKKTNDSKNKIKAFLKMVES